MLGILITHSENDRAMAEDLRASLATMAVPESAEFVSLTRVVSDEPLKAEMAAAGVVVVLLSKHCFADSRVMTEAGLAISLGKPIVAVILDETPRDALDFVEAQAWILSAGKGSPAYLAREICGVAQDLMPDHGPA